MTKANDIMGFDYALLVIKGLGFLAAAVLVLGMVAAVTGALSSEDPPTLHLEFGSDPDTGVVRQWYFKGAPGCIWVESGVGLFCLPCDCGNDVGVEEDHSIAGGAPVVSETSSLYHFGEAYGYMRPGDTPRFTFTRAVCIRYEHGPWVALGGPVPCFGFEDAPGHPQNSDEKGDPGSR